jgi:hypothetical protein
LVPGSPGERDPDEPPPTAEAVASNGGFHALRDPDAVRNSIGSHFTGVRSGRSHARDISQEAEQQ